MFVDAEVEESNRDQWWTEYIFQNGMVDPMVKYMGLS